MIVFRPNQLHKLWKMKNILIKVFLSNISVDYNENIKFLQSLNISHLKRNEFEIHDIKIHPVDWDKFILNNCCNEYNNAKRIPALMINYLADQRKLNVLDSFLYYILNNDRFHDPYIIISILNLTLYNNNYFNNFIQLYEKIVPENIYEKMFHIYIKVLLLSEQRAKALNLIKSRQMYQTTLDLIITTSPNSENWNDIEKYVEEYLSTDDNLFFEIEKPIFSKVFNEKSVSVLERILKILNGKKIFLNYKTLEQIKETFENNSEIKMRKNSVTNLRCVNCNFDLPKIQFSHETCNKLADILMNDVMKINSIEKLYQSSSPREIKDFFSFFKTCKLPFDCVIDFPNLVGLLSSENQSNVNLIENHIAIYLKNLLEKNADFKNICFIGKNMSKNRLSSMNKLLIDICKVKNVQFSFYISNNCKKDDILTLFLALKSGPNCYIVTNDEFRDHRALIVDVHLKSFFAKWQSVRQICMSGFGGKLIVGQKLIIPSQEEIVVHFDPVRNTWHIPYEYENQIKLSFHKFVNWCCMKLPEE